MRLGSFFKDWEQHRRQACKDDVSTTEKITQKAGVV